MGELSASGIEKARKAYARVLQAFADTGRATAIAAQLGVSDSTVSRYKNDKLEDAITLIYLAGFKIVDSHAVTVDVDELKGFRMQSMRLMAYENRHGQIEGEEE